MKDEKIQFIRSKIGSVGRWISTFVVVVIIIVIGKYFSPAWEWLGGWSWFYKIDDRYFVVLDFFL